MTPGIRILTTALLLAPVALAQQVADPANLMRERVSAPAPADDLAINHGAAALQQLMLKLRTRASLMMIVAHPDDEDGGMLTYESRGVGARVAMLTLTRGEGGQNLMSADFNDALGLIRTQELLAADRYMGVDQMFGTEVDFGFSKTKEETLAQWTYQRVLYDAVRAVRLYRPLVLTSVFVGGVTDGHGHHQVSGQINQEVFNAAADPKVFPEMGLPVWAPVKVYARVPFSRVTRDGMYDYATGKTVPPRFHNYVTGKDSTAEPSATINVREGDMSPALGMTYVQFARQGLALQKTQIGGNVRLAPAGAYDVGYTRYGSRLKEQPATEQGFFDGIDVTLPGIATLAPGAPASLRGSLESIDRKIAEAQHGFDAAHPTAAAPALASALTQLDALIGSVPSLSFSAVERFNVLHELRVKRVQLNDALVIARGLSVVATVAGGPQLLTTAVGVNVSDKQNNAGTEPASAEGAGAGTTVPAGGSETGEHNVKLGTGTPATKPYFSRRNLEQPFYDVSDPALRNAPMTPYPLVENTSFRFGDSAKVSLSTVVMSGKEPVVAVPPLSITLSPAAGIIRVGERSFVVIASVSSQLKEAAEGNLRLELPKGWHAEPESARWSLAAGAAPSQTTFTVVPAAVDTGKMYRLTAVATHLGAKAKTEYREGFRAVGYQGLTPTDFYTPASYKATAVDVKTAPHLRVGYLPGTGDDVAAFLPNLGVSVAVLGVKDLTAANLKQFDAIVLGVRAYAAHPELNGAGSAPLLAYAREGGVVIAQYNSAGFNAEAAPFPYAVPGDSAHNVVVETQPMTLLEPSSPMLSWPNRLGAADFKGWVEEWGHGFASSWAPEYQTPLEVHDAEQDAQKGGLLIAPVGKGAYVYCALALYRQLPEGVPGAYRLFANLLSFGKNPGRQH